MISEKIGLKLAFDGAAPEGHLFIEVFHRWMHENVLGELMVDVADYGHVVGGTNVYLCGHAGDYIVDSGGGRAGLLYKRKRAPSTPGSILEDGLARLSNVTSKLEAEKKLAVRFAKNEVALTLFDRLKAPNDAAAFAAVEAETRSSFERFLGGPVAFERASEDPRELLGARVRLR
jgi:hypothetical protein